MSNKLTKRQQEFLMQFLKVYQDLDAPVHYASLAERLGIGNVTAYEMLRLLEDRGLVQAEYQLPGEDRGPGRSMVLFSPTREANRLFNELTSGYAEDQDWETIKGKILQQLREEDADHYEELLSKLLARIPDQPSPLIYLTEMVTATLLALEEFTDLAEHSELAERLRNIGLPGEIGLGALGGISAMLSMAERANRRIANALLSNSGKYHTMLSQIGEENYRRLSEFAREAARIINR